MHMLSLDSEQAAILRDAAGAAIKFLGHRLERADPNGIISASHQLQAIKMQQVLDQLDAPTIPALDKMSPRDRDQLKTLVQVLANRPERELQQTAFEKIWALMIRTRLEQANDPERNAKLPKPGEHGPA